MHIQLQICLNPSLFRSASSKQASVVFLHAISTYPLFQLRSHFSKHTNVQNSSKNCFIEGFSTICSSILEVIDKYSYPSVKKLIRLHCRNLACSLQQNKPRFFASQCQPQTRNLSIEKLKLRGGLWTVVCVLF